MTAVFLTLLATLSANAAGGLDKGIQLTKQGKFKDAILCLRAAINTKNQAAAENATNYYYQAYCYYQLHDTSNATALFRAITTSYARSPEAKLSANFLKNIPQAQYAAKTPGDSFDAGSQETATGQNPLRNYNRAEQNDRDDDEDEEGNQAASTLPAEGKFYFTPGDHGHMNVQAAINGRPINCWFDTGAPGLFFSINQIKQLGIQPPNTPPNTFVSGWAGKRVPAWDMRLTIKLGNISRTLNAKVQAEDSDIHPLIGYSFVQGYQYQIDQSGHCVYMKRSDKNGSSSSVNSLYDIPCKIVNTKPIIPLEINGRKAPVFIDTGSNSTNFDLRTIQSLGIEIPADAPVTYGSGVGGTLAYRIIYVNLRLGPIIKNDFPIEVGGAAGCCVGQDFLSGWRYTVDESKELLRFFH